jgi:hypothetical protein
MTAPTRWSYSSLSTYESCPAKWKYSYLDNLPYAASPAMVRGTRLHADCENYIKGTLMRLPNELSKVTRMIDTMKAQGAKSEETWLLDSDWAHTAARPWIKAIIDVHWIEPGGKVLQVRDFKSGREYPEHTDQLELYSLMGLCIYPTAVRAEYGAIYLDGGYTSQEGAILRGDVMSSKLKRWNDRAIRIFEDTEHKPTPGGACKWCDYSAKKGGPCLEGV